MTTPIRILYEDNHLLVAFKPAGLLAQGDRTGDVTAFDLVKQHIRESCDKPGNVYLGLVHRLDRPVSGVMVFARTSKAASRLSRAFHDREVEKTYLCVVLGELVKDTGELTGHIERAHTRSRLSATATRRSRAAVLAFRVLGRRAGGPWPLPRGSREPATPPATTLLEVTPQTGRHHQIRLQLSAAGHPIAGDLKYRAPSPLPDRSIALHAARLRFPHPVRDEVIEISAPPPATGPWLAYASVIARRFPTARE
jgi:23S rRNA pseudouridine1911/1915/1917 synthase